MKHKTTGSLQGKFVGLCFDSVGKSDALSRYDNIGLRDAFLLLGLFFYLRITQFCTVFLVDFLMNAYQVITFLLTSIDLGQGLVKCFLLAHNVIVGSTRNFNRAILQLFYLGLEFSS